MGGPCASCLQTKSSDASHAPAVQYTRGRVQAGHCLAASHRRVEQGAGGPCRYPCHAGLPGTTLLQTGPCHARAGQILAASRGGHATPRKVMSPHRSPRPFAHARRLRGGTCVQHARSLEQQSALVSSAYEAIACGPCTSALRGPRYADRSMPLHGPGRARLLSPEKLLFTPGGGPISAESLPDSCA